MKKLFLFLVLLFVPMLVNAETQIGSVEATITSVNFRECTDEESSNDFLKVGESVKCYNLLAKLDETGEEVAFQHVVQSPADPQVEKGTKVVLYTTTDENGKVTYAVRDYNHMSGIFWTFVIFIIAVLAVGRWRGVRALLSLGLSLVLIFYFLMPLLLEGYPPLWTTLVFSIAITIISLVIISGVNFKSTVMILATSTGLLTATILAVLFGNLAQVTGLSTEEIRGLVFFYPDLNYQGLLFAGIMLGSLGAVMDVAVSITSALYEIAQNSRRLNFQQYFQAGMGVGKDILGSMVNTLIFAYVGSAYATIFTFMALGELTFWQIINLGFISEEIMRSLVGSLGLLATIPASAFLGAWFFSKHLRK